MKKILLIILVACLATWGLHAQTTHNSTRSNQVGGNAGGGFPLLGGGVTVGGNIMLPAGVKTTVSELEFSPGIEVGGFLECRFSDLFGLYLGGAYQTREWVLKTKDLGFLGSDRNKNKYEYVNIPILANLNFGSFQLCLGPNLAYLFRATQTVESLDPGSAGIDPIKTDVIEEFNQLDLGMNLKLGREFNNGLGIHIGTNINLLDVLKEQPAAPFSDVLNRNLVLSLGVSYKIFGKGVKGN